jgi:hypothetical protein
MFLRSIGNFLPDSVARILKDCSFPIYCCENLKSIEHEDVRYGLSFLYVRKGPDL